MKKLTLAIYIFFGAFAQANIEPLLGSYMVMDLGCANAAFTRYGLTVDMTVGGFEPERNSATRTLEVYVNIREAGVECRVWYEGPISFVEGGYYGSLARSGANGGRGYNCGPLNDRQAEGMVSAFIDPYFVETDVITPLNITVTGSSLSIQQNVAPPQEIRGCGNTYPVFTFTALRESK